MPQVDHTCTTHWFDGCECQKQRFQRQEARIAELEAVLRAAHPIVVKATRDLSPEKLGYVCSGWTTMEMVRDLVREDFRRAAGRPARRGGEGVSTEAEREAYRRGALAALEALETCPFSARFPACGMHRGAARCRACLQNAIKRGEWPAKGEGE